MFFLLDSEDKATSFPFSPQLLGGSALNVQPNSRSYVGPTTCFWEPILPFWF